MFFPVSFVNVAEEALRIQSVDRQLRRGPKATLMPKKSLLGATSSAGTTHSTNGATSKTEWVAVDRALAKLCNVPTVPKASSNHDKNLPPILMAAHPKARVAAMAALLREALRSSSTDSLDLCGCGVTLADLPMMAGVLALCPHIHSIDLRTTADDAASRVAVSETLANPSKAEAAIAFLGAVAGLVTQQTTVCNVLLDHIPCADDGGGDAAACCSASRQESLARRRLVELHDHIMDTCGRNKTHCDAEAQKARRLAEAAFLQRQEEIFRHSTRELIVSEIEDRKEILDDEQAMFVSLQETKNRAVRSLASTLRRKLQMVAHQRQLQHAHTEEDQAREQIASVETAEIRLLMEADCGFHARFIIAEELSIRRDFKRDETAAWVLARRAEKARFAMELAVRVSLIEEEAAARCVVDMELENAVLCLQQAFEHSAAEAKAAQEGRVERIRREEAVRRRLEDQARERAEKEEAQKQKALREFLLKQQQAREKMEADAALVRKSLRALETALFGCIARVAALWFPFLHARHEAERTTTMYCKLLTELPSASFQLPYAYSGDTSAPFRPHLFVADATTEWLHVISPSNFLAPSLNPHKREHHVDIQPNGQVPRISLWGSPTSSHRTPADSSSPIPSGPVSPTASTATSFGSSDAAAHNQAPFFAVSLREGWLIQTKAAQQEYRSRLNKFENVKSSSRAKVLEELKIVGLAIQQHRVEYARWSWQLSQSAPQQHPVAAVSPSAKSPSASAANVAVVETPFTTPDPLPDPLAIATPVVHTTHGTQHDAQHDLVMFEVDTYMKKMAMFSPHHDFITQLLVRTLHEEDVRVAAAGMMLNSKSEEPSPTPSVTKEPPVALLRSMKESIQECSIECCIEGSNVRSATDYIRFDMPRYRPLLPQEPNDGCSGAEADGSPPDESRPPVATDHPEDNPGGTVRWTSDVQPPSRVLENRFLAPGRSNAFKFGAASVSAYADSVLPSGGRTCEHASGIDIAAAQSFLHRLDLEATAEAIREAALLNNNAAVVPQSNAAVAAQVDYSAMSLAKEFHEFLSSDRFASAVHNGVVPRSSADVSPSSEVLVSNGVHQPFEKSLCKRMEASAASVCEYEPCIRFKMQLQQHSATPRLGSSTPPPDVGLLSAEPTIITSIEDGPGTHPSSALTDGQQPPPAAVGISEVLSRRNDSIMRDITRIFASVEFYASAASVDGLRAVRFRVHWRSSFDASAVSAAFHVLRCLQRKGPTDALSMPSTVGREDSLTVVVPVLVLAPRVPRSPIEATSPILVTRGDVCRIIPPSQSTTTNSVSQMHQPPRIFTAPNTHATLEANIEDMRTVSLEVVSGDPCGIGFSVCTQSNATPYLDGYEVHVVVAQANARMGYAIAPDLQLCFSSDARIWFSIMDQFGHKKDRSPLGTVFFSPSGDGQHGIPIFEVLSGSLSPCGTVPLSHSSSTISAAVNVARRLSRKASTSMLHSGRKHSVPNTARGERTTIILRAEPDVVTAAIMSQCIARLSAATTTAASSTPSPQPRSQPTTPRGSAVAEPRCASSTYHVDVFVRHPATNTATPHVSARDPIAAGGISAPSTPRGGELGVLPNNAVVLSSRLCRDVPVASAFVEMLPFSLAPLAPLPTAPPPRTPINYSNVPCGAYCVRPQEPLHVYLPACCRSDWKPDTPLASVALFRHCGLRVQLPDDGVTFDPSVIWTVTVFAPDPDSVDHMVTPMQTSRAVPSAVDVLDHHSNFYFRMAMGTIETELFTCHGDGEHIRFVSVKTAALRSMLPQSETPVDDEGDDVIQIATLKSEDAFASVTIVVTFRLLLDWVHKRMNVPTVFSRFLVPLLMDMLFRVLVVDVMSSAPPPLVSQLGLQVNFDAEVKLHMEEETKPTKGKRGKPVPPPTAEALAQMQHLVVARCTASSLIIHLPITEIESYPTTVTFTAREHDEVLGRGFAITLHARADNVKSVIAIAVPCGNQCVGIAKIRSLKEVELLVNNGVLDAHTFPPICPTAQATEPLEAETALLSVEVR